MVLGMPEDREIFIAEHKQAVPQRVVQSGISELDQLVKIFTIFYQIFWMLTLILLLHIDQITLIPLSHKHYFFNVHFNITLKLFTLLELLCLLTRTLVEHISSTQAHTC
jgi:hypothetical protein